MLIFWIHLSVVGENLFVLCKNESSGKSVDCFLVYTKSIVETNKALFNTFTHTSNKYILYLNAAFSWVLV